MYNCTTWSTVVKPFFCFTDSDPPYGGTSPYNYNTTKPKTGGIGDISLPLPSPSLPRHHACLGWLPRGWRLRNRNNFHVKVDSGPAEDLVIVSVLRRSAAGLSLCPRTAFQGPVVWGIRDCRKLVTGSAAGADVRHPRSLEPSRSCSCCLVGPRRTVTGSNQFGRALCQDSRGALATNTAGSLS